MEEEINLREYVQVLIRYWKWIAALTIVAATAALVISFLLPPTFEATAMVVITKPRYVMRFDEKFETVNDIQQPYKAYPALAMSDDLLLQTIEALNPSLPVGQTLANFRGKLTAASGSDPSLVELRVSYPDAETAARIVNTWADVFVEGVNTLYGKTAQDAAFFEKQLIDADKALMRAEEALIEFQSRNQSSVLNAQSSAYRQQLSNHLASQNTIDLIVQDAGDLRDRLRLREGKASASLVDDLAALYLEIDALSSKGAIPLQLQVTSATSLSNRTTEEQIAFLDNLVASLQEKRLTLDSEIAKLEPEILRLQGEIQTLNTESDRLTRARNVARDTYTTLARKVDEAHIAAQDESGEVQLASSAAVPTKPVGPRKKQNTIMAGALGLLTSVFGVFAVEYWRGTTAAPPSEA